MTQRQKDKPSNNKIWAFMAGAGSASVMLLAFLLPSIQDQYDRYESRKVIEKYVDLGNEFFDEEKYGLAEHAYETAFELSEYKRLDIEVKRLNAKINCIGNNPNWGSKPERKKEDSVIVDFQFLLKMIKDDEKVDRVAILNSYGVYLAGIKRIKEAKKELEEALKLDASEPVTYINLGNIYDQQNQKNEAEKCYLKAIALDKDNGRAHYNLGLLYDEQGKLTEAKKEFEKTLQIEPEDVDAKTQYNSVLEKLKK